MNNEIFISLTSADAAIAEALRIAIREFLGDKIKVFFSTSKELQGGVRHGEDWFQWIVDRVKGCDFALVLITPSSVHKPWILWESGAIYGVAMATGSHMLRKIRPVVYQVDADQIPSPIRESKAQFKRGDRAEEVEILFREILDQYRDLLPTDRLLALSKQMDAVIEAYLKQVDSALIMAGLLELADDYLQTNVKEWPERIKLKNEAAHKMADYVITNSISKERLAYADHEGLLLALAAAICAYPEKDDINFLVRVANKVKRLHVKYRILLAIDTLFQSDYISKEFTPSIEQILEKYSYKADKPLLNRIEQLRYTMQIKGK